MQTNTATTIEHPSFPFIVLGPRGELYICDSDTSLEQASLYGLVHGFYTGLNAYDSNGNRWRIAEVIAPYRVTFWTRLLASTIYNPRFSVKLRWQCEGHSDLTVLRDTLCNAIDHNGDILTQFASAERLKEIVSLCKTHDELFSKLRKHKIA